VQAVTCLFSLQSVPPLIDFGLPPPHDSGPPFQARQGAVLPALYAGWPPLYALFLLIFSEELIFEAPLPPFLDHTALQVAISLPSGTCFSLLTLFRVFVAVFLSLYTVLRLLQSAYYIRVHVPPAFSPKLLFPFPRRGVFFFSSLLFLMGDRFSEGGSSIDGRLEPLESCLRRSFLSRISGSFFFPTVLSTPLLMTFSSFPFSCTRGLLQLIPRFPFRSSGLFL